MSQQAWFDPFTSEAIERGCHCCQNRVPSCYVLNYRILPTRLCAKTPSCSRAEGDFLPFVLRNG